jgi:ribokinase
MSVDIAVVASFVIESAIQLERIPVLGESLRAEAYYLAPGGKGTNQAVAAARQGRKVGIVGKVGADLYGEMALALYEREGLGTAGIHVADGVQTAIGLVYITPSGDNCIGIYMGANEALTAEEVGAAMRPFMPARVVTAQLESPDEAVLEAFTIAKRHEAITLLNTAPARTVDPEIIGLTDIMTPNESEARLMAGFDVHDESVDLEDVATQLMEMGPRALLITCGAKGSILIERGRRPVRIEPYRVAAVDALGAGDCFSGSLAVALSEGKSISEAARWASVAAALSTLGHGGIAPLPSRQEVEGHLERYLSSHGPQAEEQGTQGGHAR